MTTRTVYILPVPVLDTLACLLVWLLPKRCRITGAGVFWMKGSVNFWELWEDPSEGGGSWTLRLGLLELVVDYCNPCTPAQDHAADREPARAFSLWERTAWRTARILDGIAQGAAWAAGRVIASRRGYSAGVFFWRNQPGWWEAWREPGAFNVRMGRLELQVDMPR